MSYYTVFYNFKEAVGYELATLFLQHFKQLLSMNCLLHL
ncbi:hypothetical protein KL86DYS1_10002 [uncultured Dysgonomonas sp.]|uniref:Uncharacterized protein n=1 Tax=uncultured Dysgonomonas sp. TaxID=206096 RepID=A0A212IT02_9BACT|nr:hypothetical protein KL86DYS1_10002 [uncultured Dysgonomonas sp.]